MKKEKKEEEEKKRHALIGNVYVFESKKDIWVFVFFFSEHLDHRWSTYTEEEPQVCTIIHS